MLSNPIWDPKWVPNLPDPPKCVSYIKYLLALLDIPDRKAFWGPSSDLGPKSWVPIRVGLPEAP